MTRAMHMPQAAPSPTLPNLIIAGVNKGGTTAVFRYLAQHPDVCASAVKETCHFLPARYGEPIAPLSAYEAHFSHHAGEPLLIESTPGYFYGGAAVADEILRCLPDARLVLILRDPVERFLSFFHFTRSNQALPANLDAETYLRQCQNMSPEALRNQDVNPWFGLEGGHYARYLDPWIERFGDRLFITFFETLKADPQGYMRDLAQFAGISPSPFEQVEFTHENKTRAYGNARLHGLALAAYRRLSPMLNRKPRIKSLAAGAYRRVNEVPMERDRVAEDRLRADLQELYANSNRALAGRLAAPGAARVQSPLPAWLCEG